MTVDALEDYTLSIEIKTVGRTELECPKPDFFLGPMDNHVSTFKLRDEAVEHRGFM